MRPRTVDREALKALLARHKHDPETNLTDIAAMLDVPPGTLRRNVFELRKEDPGIWPTDDARLRDDSLIRQLTRNAGRDLGDYQQETDVRYLRQLDRRRQGRSHSVPGSVLDGFEAGLLAAGEVIDLREDGEPYRRPARPHEAGHIIVQEAPRGEGA